MNDNVHLFPPNPAQGTSNIKDVTTMSFEQDVMEVSLKTPVVVVMYTSLCAVCTRLIPMLEKHVLATNGSVMMAKANIDENPELAQALQVQTVPTVFVFYKGQPVDGFMGAKSDSEVKAIIDSSVKRANGADPNAVAMAEQITEFLSKSDEYLEHGSWQTAMAGYMKILEADESNIDAIAGLMRSQIMGGLFEEAKAFLERVLEQADNISPQIQSVKILIDIIDEAPKGQSSDIEKPVEMKDFFELSMLQFKEGVYDQSIFTMLEIIQKSPEWEDGKAKKQLLRFFEALGNVHKVTISGRRKLSSILFS